MLDTNAVSALMKGNASIDKRVRLYGEHQIGLSVMVLYELQRGACQVHDSRVRLALLERIRQLPFAVEPYPVFASQLAAELQGGLLSRGQGIGDMDALIAAHALAANTILITRNTRHFKRISGLMIQNWEEG